VFREEIANASVRYLRALYHQMTLRTVEPDAEELAEQTCLEKIIEYIDTNNCVTIQDFSQFFKDMEFQNAFIYFELGGVYALLNKSDDDGYYTVGNSLDIVDAMEISEAYILYDDVKSRYDTIKKVFEESVLTRKVVSVC